MIDRNTTISKKTDIMECVAQVLIKSYKSELPVLKYFEGTRAMLRLRFIFFV